MNKILKSILLAGVMLTSIFAFSKNMEAKDADGNIVIVIDPGHGGEDPGTEATTGAHESNCNYEIAKAMKNELLRYEGVKVYLTREEDSWMTNMGRAMIAAEMNADFLISLHNNSGSTTNTGALAFKTVNSLYNDETEKMASAILENLAALGLANGGVQTRNSSVYEGEDYYTIIGEGIRAGIPTIIVEHCFLSNPEDALLVSNETGGLKTDMLSAMGVADANAVVSYFSLTPRTIIADNISNIVLEKGYMVQGALAAPIEGAIWVSSDPNVAAVDAATGLIQAIGEGTANIVCAVGEVQYGCTITVNASRMIGVVGGLDPTFYKTESDFKGINTDNAIAYVIYSDGTAKKVAPDSVSAVDFSRDGIQDLDITFGNLTGKLRICYESPNYVPEVTRPNSEESTKAEENTGEGTTESVKPSDNPTVTDTEATKENTTNEKKSSKSFGKEFVVYILMIIILAAIGYILVIFEIKRRRSGDRR